ncbi:MAG: lipoyl(octanoyl) transferase LipB [Dehalococcoidia bacterium]|nr:lipoyl(octanoyl) transferase LipB [Dehalococcoidia bacterium]
MADTKNNHCQVCRLGLISFPEAIRYEHALLKLYHEEKTGDILLILEHPPTVTLGRFGNIKNVLLSKEELTHQGIEYYNSDRGGDATFNCPGQLVIHPIINVRQIGPRNYIAKMQEIAINIIRSYGIPAESDSDHPGVWVYGKQIAAIGLRMRQHISTHGLSLNVNPDLTAFNVINLCGIEGCQATSLEAELWHAVSITEVLPKVEQAFAEIFNFNLNPISKNQLDQKCFGTKLT